MFVFLVFLRISLFFGVGFRNYTQYYIEGFVQYRNMSKLVWFVYFYNHIHIALSFSWIVMGIRSSKSIKKGFSEKDDITFCVICYENEIKFQKLVCGHTFCYDCILSIHDYEDKPRCPLCRERMHILINHQFDDDSSWSKISRTTVCT